MYLNRKNFLATLRSVCYCLLSTTELAQHEIVLQLPMIIAAYTRLGILLCGLPPTNLFNHPQKVQISYLGLSTFCCGYCHHFQMKH